MTCVRAHTSLLGSDELWETEVREKKTNQVENPCNWSFKDSVTFVVAAHNVAKAAKRSALEHLH